MVIVDHKKNVNLYNTSDYMQENEHIIRGVSIANLIV